MKVSKRNVPIYYERNSEFHDHVDELVVNIFQHQSVGSTGYINARTSSVFSTSDDPVSNIEIQRAKEGLDRFDLFEIGDYERRVFSRLVLGKYQTSVLRGDMGSGKSATMDYLLEVLKRPRLRTCGVCETCNPIVIKLNFNAGFQDDDLRVLVREFRKQLYDQLRQELRQLFKMTGLTDVLRSEAIHSRGDKSFYAAFDRFVQTHEDNSEWSDKSSGEKANLLFSYVDDCTKKGTENIGVIMRLVNLTKKKLRSDPACLILIFDNIDSILPEAQYKILAEILAYQEIAQVQALVAMRRATFGKFDQNRAAYAFAPIDHSGPDIKEVLLKRITNYTTNWDSLPDVAALTNPKFRQAIKNRLDYLIETKDDPHGGIQRIALLSGSSIRLGLYTAERFLINSVVPFDATPTNRAEMVRAVLIGNQKNNEISPDDHSIANLLLNTVSGDASLLNVRILQLVSAFEKDEPNRTVARLTELLYKIGDWSKDDVRVALNYLLYMRRPLLWVDGKTKYDKLTMVRSSDDVVHLTESGHYYLRELLLDLVYVQEAALSVKWNAVNIPSTVDYSKTVERFQVLRHILDELAVMDYRETSNLQKKILTRKAGNISLKAILLINRIIASLGRATLNILLQRINDSTKTALDEHTMHQSIEELRDWRSLINKWLNKERELLKSTNKRLEQLSEDYRLQLMLK